jgi:hypothetical protein
VEAETAVCCSGREGVSMKGLMEAEMECLNLIGVRTATVRTITGLPFVADV